VTASATLIGIDIGSFKTAITASNGRRVVIPSVVGWPQSDTVRQQLGRDFLIGNDVARNRIPLEIAFPFRRGALSYWDNDTSHSDPTMTPRGQAGAELLLTHAVSLVTPNPHEPVYAAITIPAIASANHKHALLRCARTVCDAVVLCSAPFCVGYGANQLHNALVIDIGASSTNLCVLTNSHPTAEQQITLPLGSELIDQELLRGISASLPGTELSLNTARRIKEKFGCLPDAHQQALVATVTGGPEMDLSEPLRQACRQMLPDIVEAVTELMGAVSTSQRATILKNVLLSGGGSQLRGLPELLTHALARLGQIEVSLIPDGVFAASAGALRLAMNLSSADWARLESTTIGFVKPSNRRSATATRAA